MNEHNDIEQMLRNVRFDIPPEIDERVLKDGLKAYERAVDKTKTTGQESRISHGVWGKAVAVALVTVAAILAFAVFVNAPSSMTLADVKAAVARQGWVHIKYDNGRERWISLLNGYRFYKHEDGTYVNHSNYDRGRRRRYHSDYNKIYDTPLEPREKPTSAWDAIGLDSYENEVGRKYENEIGRTIRNREVEKHFETVGGKRVVRFDTYVTDVGGKRRVSSQIWADLETRLPRRRRVRSQEREWITGVYDFPATGPASLYDLGVPEDTEIVEYNTIPLTPEVQEIIEAAKQAKKQFPENYRVLIWPAKESDGPCFWGVALIYRNGNKTRTQSYNINANLPLPASAEAVYRWTQTHEPVNQYLLVDGVHYHRWRENASEVIVEVRRDLSLIELDGCPTKYQWPYIFKSNLQILTGVDDLPQGCIALRRFRADQRHDYYIDPAHDYICVQQVGWRKVDGQWEKRTHSEGRFLSNFSRFPSGQWYATKRHKIQYSGSDNNIAQKRCPYLIDVKLLNENEYPADAFDAEKMIEGTIVKEY